jgi:nanoRNase/pAp phosphatase (c-di-AMP/oligoRNAs hydrolase)
MAGACEASQGIGGGHKIAAGASIPKGKINEFLLAVGSQLGQST